MKRIFTILCAALMTLSTVNASVLFSESFDARETGQLAKGTWSSGSLANDNCWYTSSAGSTRTAVVATPLSYTDYSSSSTKSVNYTANHGKEHIRFESAHTLAAGNKVYMAFLLKVTSLNTSASSASSYTNASNAIMALRINDDGQANAALHSRVLIQTEDANTYHLGIIRVGETPSSSNFATSALSTGNTYLIVAEYNCIEGEKNDIVNLYINPTKASQTIAVSSTNPSTASADASQFAGLTLWTSGNTPTNANIDEIKVATSWADLWESGGSSTPTINVSSSSVDFGTVNVGESVTKDITVSGKNLSAAISVLSSNSAVAVPSSTISIAEAEAVGGYTLTLTLTPTAAGDGTATVTLNSTDASDKVINVKWTGRKAISSIASFNLVDDYEDFALTSEPVVIRVESDYIAIQDASGALLLQKFYGSELAGIQVGDKLSGIIGLKSDADGYAETGLVTAFAVVAPQIKSSGNSADPLAVTLDNITKYGPALVKASGVSFAETGPFAAGNYTISQGSYSAKMRVPAGCDIIGQNIPESANVTGLVLNYFGNNYIQIRSKADVASGATGVDNVQSDKVQSTKVLRDGQLVIVKDGKMFNVIGVEL